MVRFRLFRLCAPASRAFLLGAAISTAACAPAAYRDVATSLPTPDNATPRLLPVDDLQPDPEADVAVPPEAEAELQQRNAELTEETVALDPRDPATAGLVAERQKALAEQAEELLPPIDPDVDLPTPEDGATLAERREALAARVEALPQPQSVDISPVKATIDQQDARAEALRARADALRTAE